MILSYNGKGCHRGSFFPAQTKVLPRAVFSPLRIGLYILSKARAVIETQGGLNTAREYTFV